MSLKLFDRWDKEIPAIKIKVFAIFCSIGLLILISIGSYSYTAVTTSNQRASMAEYKTRMHLDVAAVKSSSDRGEEILLAKINRVEQEAKLNRSDMLTQIVNLMTSDAEQKEWQKGVLRQLQLLNFSLSKPTNGHSPYGVPNYTGEDDE